jgi:hypothetical protein
LNSIDGASVTLPGSNELTVTLPTEVIAGISAADLRVTAYYADYRLTAAQLRRSLYLYLAIEM